MPSNREQRIQRIDAFCVVRHTVFDEAYHLRLWYRLNDNPVAQERLDRENHEMEEAYHREMEQIERDDALADAFHDIDDDDDADCDVETCVMCGRGYGPHAKEKTWAPFYKGAVMPQRCFKCWDI